jgi:septum formation protein
VLHQAKADKADVTLASRSPRRAEYLRLLGVDFVIVDVEIDESRRPQEPPQDYVTRLAQTKAAAGRIVDENANAILAADTCVVIDDHILDKPHDRDAGIRTLQRLAGRWHDVFTAVTLDHPSGGTDCVHTRVLFRPLALAEIAAYWASGEPQDKAGGYGIQGLGGALVARIEGSYSNVVGLPLAETLALLDRAQIAHRLVG